jgi:hypothetical protein
LSRSAAREGGRRLQQAGNSNAAEEQCKYSRFCRRGYRAWCLWCGNADPKPSTNQWFEGTISRIRARYELTIEEFTRLTQEKMTHGGGRLRSTETPRLALSITPHVALMRYWAYIQDEILLDKAIAAKEASATLLPPFETWQDEIPWIWVEQSLRDLSARLSSWASAEYELIKCLVGQDQRPENVRILIDLFLMPSPQFDQHEDALTFLCGLPSPVWEEHLLDRLEHLSIDEVWERDRGLVLPLCKCCHAFSEPERVISMLAAWQQELMRRFPAPVAPPPAPVDDSRGWLLEARYGREEDPPMVLGALQDAVPRLRAEREGEGGCMMLDATVWWRQ